MFSAIPWKTLGSLCNELHVPKRVLLRHSLGKRRGWRQFSARAFYMATSTWPGAMTCALITRLELRASPGMRTASVPLRAMMTT